MALSFDTDDTVKLIVSFTDWAEEGQTGPLIDVDDPTVTITYGTTPQELESGNLTRDDVGVYSYEWQTPTNPANFTLTFAATKNTKPVVSRYEVDIKKQVA